ncbi:MAG: type VI secretion system-associated FHA domain protein TagH, partial [Gammaproteobacteria bacterium]|nr:type VI secretion system-associated FHA domain protein TagH [Gammaproteobacteria bacterium]
YRTSMTLKLEIISEHRDIVGDDAVREFRAEGGTIGRSLNNDWILPDPDKFISGKHATIDCKGGIYYIVDISTNGVYANDERKPIGKGNPRRLFNGDHLHLGDFDILVSIDEGEDLDMPADPKPTVVPDHIEQLVEEDRIKTGVQLLDEDEITGDVAFESVLYTGDDDALPAEAADEQGDPVPPVLEPEMPEPSRVSVSQDDLFDAFLDGLQISRAELHPSIDVAEAMSNAGEILREFISGIEKMLHNRAELKSTFRLDQTTILPRQNNPIKLSQNTGDLVKQLLVGRDGEYLGPRDAVREVCQDLLAHQEAFLDAMTEAFIEFSERFDPEELTASFERSLGRKPLFQILNQLKYWGLYKDLYPIMTERGGGRFPQMFAEEFVKAYERHIIESLREHRLSHPLPKLKLEPLSEEAFMAEQAGADESPEEPSDQIEHATDKAPGEVLEDIGDLSGLNELVDFDDLEAQSDTVVFDDDADQAKA